MHQDRKHVGTDGTALTITGVGMQEEAKKLVVEHHGWVWTLWMPQQWRVVAFGHYGYHSSGVMQVWPPILVSGEHLHYVCKGGGERIQGQLLSDVFHRMLCTC